MNLTKSGGSGDEDNGEGNGASCFEGEEEEFGSEEDFEIGGIDSGDLDGSGEDVKRLAAAAKYDPIIGALEDLAKGFYIDTAQTDTNTSSRWPSRGQMGHLRWRRMCLYRSVLYRYVGPY